MWAAKSSPYSKSKWSRPLRSTGIAQDQPCASADRATSAPNCSSTRMPASSAGAPWSMARQNPSKITDLASMIVAVSSGVGSPRIPNR